MRARHLISTMMVTAAVLGSALPASAAEPLKVSWESVSSESIRHFAVDGERLLYSKSENKQLVLRDLRTGLEQQIARIEGGAYDLALSGQYAYYFTQGAQGSTPFMLDMETGKRYELAKGDPSLRLFAGGKQIYSERGDYTSYPDGREEAMNYMLWLNDPVKNIGIEVARVKPEVVFGWPIAFDGQFLVWAEQIKPSASYTEPRATIYAVDVTTKQQTTKQVQGYVSHLQVEGGRVLYSSAPKDIELSLWDVKTNTDQRVATVGATAPNLQAALHGDRVAYLVGENSNRTLNVVDLTTGERRWNQAEYLWAPTLADRHLFVLGQGNALYTLLDMAPTPAPAGEPVFYTVRSGDLLWKIAARNKVSLADLIRTNNMINPHWIMPGQQLYLPAPVSPETETYRVQAGDTLAKIAVRYQTSVDNIAHLNQRAGNTLLIGETLTVSRGPERTSSGRLYAVMPGDTIYNIAKRLGVTPATLMQRNNWQSPVSLQIGWSIYLEH